MRTQVAIIGGGPAGLLLSHLLHRAGVGTVVVEAQSRAYAEHRVRAGVLEHGTAELLDQVGLGERLRREGMVHRGIELRFAGGAYRLDLHELTGGRAITVYGQQEVVKDLIAARLAAAGPICFEARDVRVEGLESQRPRVRFMQDGEPLELECDFVAGCDGFHGVCRPSIPAAALTVHERAYPFAWLGILADAPPSHGELVYSSHERGFALFSMRSAHLTRLYLQVAPGESLDAWPDARIWEELHRRLDGGGWRPNEGAILEKGITGMRSFVAEPMQHGRLFLAGDAAHIVPPTGAKGLNLAVADVRVLAAALQAFYARGDEGPLRRYSGTCLKRVWRAEHFSWWMTAMLHRFPDGDTFQRKLQLAQLDYVVSSRPAAQSLAENYVGLPFLK
jgi:p-hydroxybenzoate 3-monooxygenase